MIDYHLKSSSKVIDIERVKIFLILKERREWEIKLKKGNWKEWNLKLKEWTQTIKEWTTKSYLLKEKGIS